MNGSGSARPGSARSKEDTGRRRHSKHGSRSGSPSIGPSPCRSLGDIQPDEPRDAGHLAAQELVLRLARQHGRRADFELVTRPSDPARSIDVALRDDAAGALIVVEIWNRLDDLGAAARAMTRKASEAEGAAVLAARDGPPYRVAICWLLVDTAANRRLVARFPEILETRFPGSSLGWVRCLVDGAPPPNEPGLA